MQLTISLSELLLIQEQRVVQQSQCIENIKLGLLRQDQRIVNQGVEADLEHRSIGAVKGGLRSVVEEVCGTDGLVFWVPDDG